MMYLNIKGIVIKTTDYKEHDKILTLLSFEKGKISIIAKGVRKQGAKLSYCARLFYCGSFECVISKEKAILTGCSMLFDFSGISSDLENIYCASHFAEVASAVIMENQPAEEEMKLLLNSLYVLSIKKMDIKLLTAVFEIRMLSIEGYAPFMDKCVLCSKITQDVKFSLEESGLVCCRDGMPISQPVIDIICYIMESDSSKIFSFKAADNIIDQLFRISRKYTDKCLDRNFKKLDIFS